LSAGSKRCTDGVKFGEKESTLLYSSTPNFTPSAQGCGVQSKTENFTESSNINAPQAIPGALFRRLTVQIWRIRSVGYLVMGFNFEVDFPEICSALNGINVAWWSNSYDVPLTNQRVAVRLPAVPLSDNNLRQVVYTHLPLSPSSIIWYWSNGDDALWLGR